MKERGAYAKPSEIENAASKSHQSKKDKAVKQQSC
jgi:ribosomal protein S21